MFIFMYSSLLWEGLECLKFSCVEFAMKKDHEMLEIKGKYTVNLIMSLVMGVQLGRGSHDYDCFGLTLSTTPMGGPLGTGALVSVSLILTLHKLKLTCNAPLIFNVQV